ncbi:MAG TPA: sigma-70 family RNA polymerase sigma factor [Candidatus Limnocylindria bacterium]|nr:sigma-70 family RNA polymerase sigma factor [Candidatus Limnocylindria bacterium]
MATILMEPPPTQAPAAIKPGAEEVAEVRRLVAQAQGGDMTAFDSLVGRYQDRIYGLCYHLTSNHEEAADLAQDAFVKAWQALASFKGDASFFTWVYRIAVNTTLNYLKTRRKKTPHLSLNDLDFNAENDPDLVALVSDRTPRRDLRLKEIQERLNAGLQKLSEEHRTVLVLHDIQGLAHDEIASLVGCNPGTVRSRLFYARQQMQAWLADLWE